VYLFPERSGIDVSPEELAQLTSIDGVRAAKLSGRPNNHFDRYVQLAAPGSLIYSGDDSSYPAVVAAGGAGIVSGVSSAFPELFGALTRVLKTEDQVAVTEAQTVCSPWFKSLDRRSPGSHTRWQPDTARRGTHGCHFPQSAVRQRR
jgi:dihydrodipicolinate synthase/N-acetylneuraminate lyase